MHEPADKIVRRIAKINKTTLPKVLYVKEVVSRPILIACNVLTKCICNHRTLLKCQNPACFILVNFSNLRQRQTRIEIPQR